MRALPVIVALVLTACGGGSSSSCSASNCTGCCDTKGVCQTGNQAAACGTGAAACVACSGTDMCSASKRTCGPCGPENCSGCCTSDQRCVVEVRERDTYCGINGGACVDCAAASKLCSSSFVCM